MTIQLHEDGWLLPLLSKLQVKPARYLGEQTVEALALCLAAFSWGRNSVQAGSGDADYQILREFARWLGRSEFEGEMKGWVHLVKERSAIAKRDDQLAVFFELFSAFCDANPEKCWSGMDVSLD